MNKRIELPSNEKSLASYSINVSDDPGFTLTPDELEALGNRPDKDSELPANVLKLVQEWRLGSTQNMPSVVKASKVEADKAAAEKKATDTRAAEKLETADRAAIAEQKRVEKLADDDGLLQRDNKTPRTNQPATPRSHEKNYHAKSR